MTPYRTPGESERPTRAVVEHDCPDGDVAPSLFLYWIGSVARLGLGYAHHAPFGGEMALAMMSVVTVAYWLKDAFFWVLERHVAWIARRCRRTSLRTD